MSYRTDNEEGQRVYSDTSARTNAQAVQRPTGRRGGSVNTNGMSRSLRRERLYPMKKPTQTPHRGSSTQACQDQADDWYRPWRCLEPLLHAQPGRRSGRSRPLPNHSGPNARLTRWEQYFKKAEIVNQTLIAVCTRASSAPSPSNQTQARFSGNPDPTGTCLLGAEAEPQPLIRVTDQQIVATLPQSK